jgi:hypothetical protein
MMAVMGRSTWAVLLTIPLVACASGDDGECSGAECTTSSSSGVGGNSGSTTGATGGGATSSSASSGSGGSGTGGASTGGGGQSGMLEPLFPLQTGLSWTFSVSNVGIGGVCASGNYTMSVLKQESVGGKDAYEFTNWCSAASGTSYYARGDSFDELLLYFNNAWDIVQDGNVSDGQSWVYQGVTYQWKDEGTVNILAGAFDDCWTAQIVGENKYSTYCRGIGLVRSYSADVSGNGWDAQLLSYTP